MNLTPREKDKLLVSVAAMVAARRLERGVRLNYPEAVALITDYVLEGARDGKTVAELMRDGATVLSREQVMEGIAPDQPFVAMHLPAFMQKATGELLAAGAAAEDKNAAAEKAGAGRQ